VCSAKIKKEDCFYTVLISILVGPVGLEPTTKGFWFVWLSSLPGLCLHHIHCCT